MRDSQNPVLYTLFAAQYSSEFVATVFGSSEFCLSVTTFTTSADCTTGMHFVFVDFSMRK